MISRLNRILYLFVFFSITVCAQENGTKVNLKGVFLNVPKDYILIVTNVIEESTLNFQKDLSLLGLNIPDSYIGIGSKDECGSLCDSDTSIGSLLPVSIEKGSSNYCSIRWKSKDGHPNVDVIFSGDYYIVIADDESLYKKWWNTLKTK